MLSRHIALMEGPCLRESLPEGTDHTGVNACTYQDLRSSGGVPEREKSADGLHATHTASAAAAGQHSVNAQLSCRKIGFFQVPGDIDINDKVNMEKFKTGLLKDSIEVIHDLNKIKKEKPLNSSEKQLLNTAKKILAEEVSIIKNITKNEANDFISNVLN